MILMRRVVQCAMWLACAGTPHAAVATEIEQAGKNRHAGELMVANVKLLSKGLPDNLYISASVYTVFNSSGAHIGSEERAQEVLPQHSRGVRLSFKYSF